MTRMLILGGARSGKSAHAERLAATSGKEVIYIATAQARDDEMAARIDLHRQQRPAGWTTIEEPLALGAAMRARSTPDNLLLIDCLTVWLSNLLFADGLDFPEVGRITAPPTFVAQRTLFMQALEQVPGDIVLVSNEVGMGIIPQGAITRWYVDEAGRLNQAVAAVCERAVWVAAGLPLMLKGAPC
ncbi:MAG: adenosylcobinamide kinase/adenosylcobinamide-phosphate guanylyltransferase [Bradyrhizobium sp.]|jgi:adenosylcobinamide kinase/adenosylcobinamide-phosphate guanylyltransferase